MPELPEVERGAKLLRDVAKGKRITQVESFEDTIVFAGTTHEEFANALTGRAVVDAQRYGKVFYMTLEGEGKNPVMHFGMTGMLQVKGEAPTYYRENGRKKANPDEWPPKFSKFVLHLSDPQEPTNEASSSTSDQPTQSSVSQIAFLDPRRLSRIRLCTSPLTEPPISELGFDPILSMAPLDTFSARIHKRSCPIKALLLDQSFSAGVGNWVADEILYHARVHPEQRCNTLGDGQIQALHEKMVYVVKTAVGVNADDSLFPENWLFKHRWGKGKEKGKSGGPLLLPSGQPATIKWITVGGRTSAYVTELQKVQSPKNIDTAPQEDEEEPEGDESDLTSLADEDPEPAAANATASTTRRSSRKRTSGHLARQTKPSAKRKKARK